MKALKSTFNPLALLPIIPQFYSRFYYYILCALRMGLNPVKVYAKK